VDRGLVTCWRARGAKDATDAEKLWGVRSFPVVAAVCVVVQYDGFAGRL
jgi:hypothetical protein